MISRSPSSPLLLQVPPGFTVDLHEPDVVIIVQVVGRVTGVCVVQQFTALHKFNIRTIQQQFYQEPTEDAEKNEEKKGKQKEKKEKKNEKKEKTENKQMQDKTKPTAKDAVHNVKGGRNVDNNV